MPTGVFDGGGGAKRGPGRPRKNRDQRDYYDAASSGVNMGPQIDQGRNTNSQTSPLQEWRQSFDEYMSTVPQIVQQFREALEQYARSGGQSGAVPTLDLGRPPTPPQVGGGPVPSGLSAMLGGGTQQVPPQAPLGIMPSGGGGMPPSVLGQMLGGGGLPTGGGLPGANPLAALRQQMMMGGGLGLPAAGAGGLMQELLRRRGGF